MDSNLLAFEFGEYRLSISYKRLHTSREEVQSITVAEKVAEGEIAL
jgi:hypothetical protein